MMWAAPGSPTATPVPTLHHDQPMGIGWGLFFVLLAIGLVIFVLLVKFGPKGGSGEGWN